MTADARPNAAIEERVAVQAAVLCALRRASSYSDVDLWPATVLAELELGRRR